MSHQDAPIQIVPYDAQWDRLFREEQRLLHQTLSPWLTGPIEHIGSTAVPGLAAKPVIDIMAAVDSLDGSRGAIPALENLNYLYAPYRHEVMHWFCKPHPSFRTHHLHLVPYQSDLWQARLLFRDHLRSDPSVTSAYTHLKRTLAATHKHDREAYTEGKSEFINRVLAGEQ